MIESFRLFELDESGHLVSARSRYDGIDLEYSTLEEAQKEVEHSLKQKEYTILKMVRRDYSTIIGFDDIIEDFM